MKSKYNIAEVGNIITFLINNFVMPVFSAVFSVIVTFLMNNFVMPVLSVFFSVTILL